MTNPIFYVVISVILAAALNLSGIVGTIDFNFREFVNDIPVLACFCFFFAGIFFGAIFEDLRKKSVVKKTPRKFKQHQTIKPSTQRAKNVGNV